MTAPSPIRIARERVDSLDALRGLLAIGVMVYHLLIWLYDIELHSLGSYAVYVFFVLSGFAMTWVYSDTPVDGFPIRSYAIARIARIAPLWWVVIIATTVMELPTRPRVGPLMENLLFLSALTPTRDIATGGWSIEVEIVFYLLFPLLITLVKRPSQLAVLMTCAAVIRWVYVDSVWPPGAARPDIGAYFTIPTFVVFFVGGVVVARMRREVVARPSQLPFIAGAAVLALVFGAGVWSLRTVLSGPFALVLGLACVAAVALVSLSANPQSAMLRRAYEVLGATSFATYLLHPLVYTVLARAGFPAPVTFAATVVATVVAAWCVNRWLEMPVRTWIRRRFDAPSDAVPV